MRSDLAECELCSQFKPVEEMRLFLVKDKRLVETIDRSWQYKAGVRHICRECCKAVED